MNANLFSELFGTKEKLHREYLLIDIDPIGVSWQK